MRCNQHCPRQHTEARVGSGKADSSRLRKWSLGNAAQGTCMGSTCTRAQTYSYRMKTCTQNITIKGTSYKAQPTHTPLIKALATLPINSRYGKEGTNLYKHECCYITTQHGTWHLALGTWQYTPSVACIWMLLYAKCIQLATSNVHSYLLACCTM